MKKTEDDIIVQEVFKASVVEVWRAITHLAEMKKWFFENIDDFKPVVGSKSCFPVMSGSRTFIHLWEVTAVEAEKRLVYSWKYAGYPGISCVSFELGEQNEQTRLVLKVHVLDDFPDEIPEFRRDNCFGGWQYLINQRLKAYLEK